MGLLVLNVDHLPTHLLGPYGNSSVPTPTLNAWAARGLTADFVFQSGIGDRLPGRSSLAQFRRKADLCLSPCAERNSDEGNGDEGLGQSRLGEERQSVWPVDPCEWDGDSNVHWIPVRRSLKLAKKWEDTAVARYLERALSHWTEAILPRSPTVWLDLPLFSGRWDAPLEWRNYLAGDDDPEVYAELEPPYLVLPSDGSGGLFADGSFDPDLRMGYEHAAGAMIMLLDHACEWLQTCVEAFPRGQEMAIVLTSESGFSLGEHYGIGSFLDRLWSEEAQVPLMMYVGAAGKYPARLPQIISQQQCLQRWWDLVENRPAPSPQVDDSRSYDCFVAEALAVEAPILSDAYGLVKRQATISRSPNQIAIRTAAWSFVWKVSQAPQLFVRPDDRFEQNDVASRCSELVASIQWYLPEFLWHFGSEDQRHLPEYLGETWRRACESIAQEARGADFSNWAQRSEDHQNGRLQTLDDLPATLWAAVA